MLLVHNLKINILRTARHFRAPFFDSNSALELSKRLKSCLQNVAAVVKDRQLLFICYKKIFCCDLKVSSCKAIMKTEKKRREAAANEANALRRSWRRPFF